MDNSDIIVKDSGKEGPLLAIMGGVHGNEHCGERAIKELAPGFTPTKGKVTFIIANKAALAEDVRFVESNLNRAFNATNPTTLEERTAAAIKPYLEEADALLDLHASLSEDTVPFCICEEHSLEAASVLPARRVMTGIDAFHAGSSDGFMNEQGKVGICIECGWLGDTEGTTAVAKRAIRAFCEHYGVIDGEPGKQEQERFHAKKQYKAERGPFTPSRAFNDFDPVRKGQVIGQDGGVPVVAEQDEHVLFVRERAAVGEECFMTAEKR